MINLSFTSSVHSLNTYICSNKDVYLLQSVYLLTGCLRWKKSLRIYRPIIHVQMMHKYMYVFEQITLCLNK